MPRVFVRWQRQEDGMSVERALALGDVIKEARVQQGIALRELARRSGVSAGQISRIESGEVERPSRTTLTALATALGRSPIPLLYLGEQLDADELHRHLRRFEETLETRGDLGDYTDRLNDRGEADPQMLWDFTGNLSGLVQDLEPEAAPFARELGEIAAAWPSLTDERRRLARVFIADQAVLSQLDRMPKPPGRYVVSIDLQERNPDE